MLIFQIIFVPSSTCSVAQSRLKRAWIVDSYEIEEGQTGPFPYVLGKVRKSKALFEKNTHLEDTRHTNTLKCSFLDISFSYFRIIVSDIKEMSLLVKAYLKKSYVAGESFPPISNILRPVWPGS